MKSDGTNTYWAFDAGDNDWSSARIWTHGYVAGGYKNTSSWRTVNRTVHSTDVTTNIGDIIDRSGGYFAGSWNDITHFCHSFDNSFRASSNYTSAYNMATESGRTHQGSWDMTVNRNSMGSFQDHVFAGGNSYLYGGGNSRTDVMNLTTEVMRTSGFPPDKLALHWRFKGTIVAPSKYFKWNNESTIGSTIEFEGMDFNHGSGFKTAKNIAFWNSIEIVNQTGYKAVR